MRYRCAVLLLLALAGCSTVATTGSGKPIADLKTIAGKWSGTGYSPGGINPLEWTIKEDGTVDVVVATAGGRLTGVGRMSVKDGQAFYESATSSGPVTLHEDGGRRVLKYQGLFKKDGAPPSPRAGRGQTHVSPWRLRIRPRSGVVKRLCRRLSGLDPVDAILVIAGNERRPS